MSNSGHKKHILTSTPPIYSTEADVMNETFIKYAKRCRKAFEYISNDDTFFGTSTMLFPEQEPESNQMGNLLVFKYKIYCLEFDNHNRPTIILRPLTDEEKVFDRIYPMHGVYMAGKSIKDEHGRDLFKLDDDERMTSFYLGTYGEHGYDNAVYLISKVSLFNSDNYIKVEGIMIEEHILSPVKKSRISPNIGMSYQELKYYTW